MIDNRVDEPPKKQVDFVLGTLSTDENEEM